MCYFVIDALINRQFYYHQINSVAVLLLTHWECSTILVTGIGTCFSIKVLAKNPAVSMVHQKDVKKGEKYKSSLHIVQSREYWLHYHVDSCSFVLNSYTPHTVHFLLTKFGVSLSQKTSRVKKIDLWWQRQ